LVPFRRKLPVIVDGGPVFRANPQAGPSQAGKTPPKYRPQSLSPETLPVFAAGAKDGQDVYLAPTNAT
jgi:hypothetical protein